MPGEDGFSFIRKVRALKPEQGGKTPAVAVTAYAEAESTRKSFDAGFDAHLAKPADETDLCRCCDTGWAIAILNLKSRGVRQREGPARACPVSGPSRPPRARGPRRRAGNVAATWGRRAPSATSAARASIPRRSGSTSEARDPDASRGELLQPLGAPVTVTSSAAVAQGRQRALAVSPPTRSSTTSTSRTRAPTGRGRVVDGLVRPRGRRGTRASPRGPCRSRRHRAPSRSAPRDAAARRREDQDTGARRRRRPSRRAPARPVRPARGSAAASWSVRPSGIRASWREGEPSRTRRTRPPRPGTSACRRRGRRARTASRRGPAPRRRRRRPSRR